MVNTLSIQMVKLKNVISVVFTCLSAESKGYCTVSRTLNNHQKYYSMKVYVLRNFCTDLILSTDFQEHHESVTVQYRVHRLPLTLTALTAVKIDPPKLFFYIKEDCKPIASKSRKYSKRDRGFIKTPLSICELNNSPWRFQMLVVQEKRKAKNGDWLLSDD